VELAADKNPTATCIINRSVELVADKNPRATVQNDGKLATAQIQLHKKL